MDTTQNLKNNSKPVDVLIVGQGIAGSVLAFSLIKAGYSVAVISQPQLSACSAIAAGIWNPIVFKRLTASWMAEKVIPELMAFYATCQEELQASFMHQRAIMKPLYEEQEKKLWLKKQLQIPLFLDHNIYENFLLTNEQMIPAYSNVLSAGNIDTVLFLNQMKSYVTNTHTYVEGAFSFQDLVIKNDGISYQSFSAKKIVFCDGHLISKNPFFDWVPMKPAKGEVLTIQCKGIQLGTSILNKGVFILPLGNDVYKVGATYEWKDLSENPTEIGLSELEHKLRAIISLPYTILKHEAGIRPSVVDRRPVVGKHPRFHNMYTFNGFGTKAVMLAPYFAKELTQNMLVNAPIHPDVNPQRFYKK